MEFEPLSSTVRKGVVYLSIPLSLLVVSMTVFFEIRPFIGPAFGVFAGSVLAVVLWRSREITLPLTVGRDAPLDWRLPLIGTALYVAGVFTSYRFTLHSRPTVHYILFVGIAGFIAYQIYRNQPREHVLIQILLTAATTFWSSQLAYPAGMRSQDTPELLIGFQQVRDTGTVFEAATRYAHTPIQPIQAVQYVDVLGIEFMTAYNLTAVFALTATVLLVGIIDRPLPRISRQTVLYSTLFFVFLSFTLNRGHIPNKINFFTPLTMVVVFVVLYTIFGRHNRNELVVVGLVSCTALVFGHDYSAGVTILIVGSMLGYGMLLKTGAFLSDTDQRRYVSYSLCLLYCVLFVAYAVVTEGIVLRSIGEIAVGIGGLLFGAPGEFGGTGRYGELGFELILLSTAVELLVFFLGISGLFIILLQSQLDLDLVASWIVVGLGLIVLSLVISAVHLPPHRIYALLGLFGLNITMAIGLQLLSATKSRIPGTAVVVGVVCLFALFSLLSPIAAMPLSPLSDELPHDRHYETAPNNHGVAWIESHGMTEEIIRLHHTRYTDEQDLLTMTVPHREMELVSTETQTAMIDRTEIPAGTAYMYSTLGEQTGVHAPVDPDAQGDRRTLGGQDFVWIEPNPDSVYDDRLYANGETTVYERTTITTPTEH